MPARLVRALKSLAPALVALAIGAVAWPSTGTDDSYLTYWPAHALARYGEIVNVNGARLEQSSSLLWTVILALASRVTHVDVESLGVPLSVLAALGTIGASGVLARRIDPAAEGAARWIVALAFPSLWWAFSGMETALAALLWTALAASAIPYVFARDARVPVVAPVAALAGFLLVRPEAPFVAFAALAPIAVLALVASRRDPALRVAAARAGTLLAAGAVVAVAIGAFRRAYFGAWFPQPAHAKVAPAASALADRALDGLLYVLGFESVRGSRPPGWPARIEVGLLIAAALVASALAVKRFVAAPAREGETGRAKLATALFFAAPLAFVVAVGGDWMGGWRFLCTPLPCAAAILAASLAKLSPRPRVAAVGGVIACELLVLARAAAVPSLAIPLWVDLPAPSRAYPFFVRRNVPHLRDAAFLPAMTAALDGVLARKAPPAVLLSGQAGYVAYHVGESFFGKVRFLDRVSLATRDLEDCPLLSGHATDVGFSIASTAPLFDPASPVHAACGIPVPDVVFDNGRRELFASMTSSHRYAVVYEEGPEVLPADAKLPESRSYQYLGVRTSP